MLSPSVRKKKWQDEALVLDWIKCVWPGALLGLTTCPGHFSLSLSEQSAAQVHCRARRHPSNLQLLDGCINKPFKDRIKRCYMKGMNAGWLKRASAAMLCAWVSCACTPEKLIRRAFEKCSISNTLDGTEDRRISPTRNSRRKVQRTTITK